MPRPGVYALPWLERITDLLQMTPEKQMDDRLPLWTAFTHREEVLYLAVALGFSFDGTDPTIPTTGEVKHDREWKVGTIAPYLGHIALEACLTTDLQERIRIVVNGKVMPGFEGELYQDTNGSYDHDQVCRYLQKEASRYKGAKLDELTFLK